MTRIYKVKYVDIKTGKKDVVFIEAESQEQAKEKLNKRIRGAAASSLTLVFKPRSVTGKWT